jgi:phosphinothricin acetyltransferase
MEIVNVSKEDYPQIRNILNYYIENTNVNFETKAMSVEHFNSMIMEITHPFLVAKENNTVLGYAYLSSYNSKRGYDITADLTIYLDHANKSKGLGTKLYNELLNRAKETNIENIVSLIEVKNKESISFHEKFGFEKVATLDNVGYKNGRYLSVYYYMKRIKQLKIDN